MQRSLLCRLTMTFRDVATTIESSETLGQPILLLAKGQKKVGYVNKVPVVAQVPTPVIRTLAQPLTAFKVLKGNLEIRTFSGCRLRNWPSVIKTDKVVENNCNQLTQRRGSSKSLMALLTNDGFVAKACHVHSVDVGGKLIIGHPDYGPMPIGKAQTVQHQSSSETHGQPNLLLAKGKRKLDKSDIVSKEKMDCTYPGTISSCIQLTQRRGSSKSLMALLTNDDFVAKACHVHSVDVGGKLIIGHPDYGPMPIGKAQTVHAAELAAAYYDIRYGNINRVFRLPMEQPNSGWAVRRRQKKVDKFMILMLGSKWGEVMELEENNNDYFVRKRLCVKTKQTEVPEAVYCSDDDSVKGDDVQNVVDHDGEAVQISFFGEQVDERIGNEFVAINYQEKDAFVDPFNIFVILKQFANKDAEILDRNTSIPFPPGFTPQNASINKDDLEVHITDHELSNGKSAGCNSRILEEAEKLEEQFSSVNQDNEVKIKEGGSILMILDEMIKVGQNMGYSMEGLGSSKKDWIRELSNNHKVSFLTLQDRLRWRIFFLWRLNFTGENYNFDHIVCEALVFAPQSLTYKRMLWSYLASLISQWDDESIVMGDFNEVRSVEERWGSTFNALGASVFNDFITNSGLSDVQLEDIFSDHRPILLREIYTDFGATPFRLYHSWFNLAGFDHLVTSTWNSIVLSDCNDSYWQRPVRGGREAQQLSCLLEILGTWSYQTWSVLPKDEFPTRWVKCVPIKINVFAWKIFLDRLPTRLNLYRRGVVITSVECPNCGEANEDTTHIFFNCGLALDVMHLVCRWWNLDRSSFSSYSDWLVWFKALRMGSKKKDVLEGVFYVAWWCIWSYRNHLLFADKKPRKDYIFDDVVLRSFSSVVVGVIVVTAGSLDDAERINRVYMVVNIAGVESFEEVLGLYGGGKVKVLRVFEMMEHDSRACIYGALVSVDTNDIFSNEEFPILDVLRKIISEHNGRI
ncbi:RNA-directed DNA polymerase, eukaryota [Tanacetum coccineum]